ncbi:hypothetical protein [Epilithonimonas sp. UC225_85]|uniref:hypothetical protein n=1 Tax=Epilithonimonas sp. UC225_85 TaxID=3350167 RepID=UPI0036D3A40B
MKKVFSNNVFNWILIIISVLNSIDNIYLLSKEFEDLNILFFRIVVFTISSLSFLSFFILKLNKEFYSRLFILANLILLSLLIYYSFIVDKLLYSVTRTDLVSNPAIHIKFFIGIILFYYSIKFSQESITKRQSDYGLMIILFGLFLIILNFTKVFDYTSGNFSLIDFIIKLFLSAGIIFIGNRLRLSKLKFKASIIITIILAVICGMI